MISNFPMDNHIQIDITTALERISYMRRFFDIYSVCLLELCNEMNLFGLDHIAILLIRLFNSFKLQIAQFNKFNYAFLTLRSSLDASLDTGSLILLRTFLQNS